MRTGTRKLRVAAAAVLAVLVLAFLLAHYVTELRTIRVLVEGTRLDVTPQVIDGQLLVPYRAVAERLGARASWNPAERTVTVTDGDAVLTMTLDHSIAVFNGRDVQLEAVPVLSDGRVLVPLRFLADSLGYRLHWEQAARTARLVPVPALRVRVAVPDGVPALSMIRLLRERPSMGRHVTISYEVVRSPELMAARIVSGEADIAIVPTNLAAVLYNRNVPYRLAAATVWGMLYVVSSEGIGSWQDLRGREIYTFGRGLTPDIVFRYLLAQHGLSADRDVTLRYMGSGMELAQAMIAGRVNTAVLPEPLATKVMMRRQEVSVAVDLQQAWAAATGLGLSYPQASLLISNVVSNSHPEFVERFLHEVARSAAWVNDNPQMAGVWAEELQTGLTARVVEHALPRCNIRFVGAIEARAAIEAFLRVLGEFSPETIGGRLPSEAFFLQPR